MNTKVFVMLAALLFTAACQLPGSSSSCNAQIAWVNFIQVGSTQYVAGPQTPTALQESELGPVYTQVKFKVSGNVCDPSYRLKDGDAAFLDPGTPIYQVRGHPPSAQLAAPFNGSIDLYSSTAVEPCARSSQASLVGKDHRLNAIAKVELHENSLDMGSYG